MKTVAIVYHSGMGHTAKVAEAIAAGARTQPDTTVNVFVLRGDQITEGRWQDDAVMEQLTASDAIIFGAPTYMGMVSGVFKCFADATAPVWFQQTWKDKIAGGFTSSGYASGDKVMTLHYLVTLAAQLRMIWVGPGEMPSNVTQNPADIDRWGYYIGVGALGSVSDENLPGPGDLKTAELYGARLAQAAHRWVSVSEVA
jgi:NAD(P)H dehydrogenase (quinone)